MNIPGLLLQHRLVSPPGGQSGTPREKPRGQPKSCTAGSLDRSLPNPDHNATTNRRTPPAVHTNAPGNIHLTQRGFVLFGVVMRSFSSGIW